MSTILNQQICLALNSAWLAYELRTVRKAVEDIMSINPQTGKPPFMFLDLTYEQREDGSFNTEVLLNARPVSVDEWMALEVRPCDIPINCGRRELRAPTIIVSTCFTRVPDQKPRFSPEAVYKRDGGVCQATKRKLAPGEGNMGHDHARSKGGAKSWTNIALLDRRINSMQGTRSFAEMGWDIQPKEPRTHKVFLTLDDARHEDHRHFLKYQHSAS